MFSQFRPHRRAQHLTSTAAVAQIRGRVPQSAPSLSPGPDPAAPSIAGNLLLQRVQGGVSPALWRAAEAQRHGRSAANCLPASSP
jgi:hypothetical protein